MKPDDSSLSPVDLQFIERRASSLLDRADAWNRYPVPIEDLLAAAEVKLATHSLFDPSNLLAYLKGKAEDVASNVKSAVSKILGIYDAAENLIHVDATVGTSKQIFLKLHETGHHDIPTHKKLFRFFQDCEKTLSPEIADQFEREANNFARFVLFKGDAFMRQAADHPFEIKTPIKLASVFGASIYASAREFARTNTRACVVYVLEPIEFADGVGAFAKVRRVEPSSSFRAQFGYPTDETVTSAHFLGPLLPIGRRMTRPTVVSYVDLNGTAHECVAEAFDTKHNVLFLMYPIRALTSSTVALTVS